MNILVLRAMILEAIASTEIETGKLSYDTKLKAATQIIQEETGLKEKEAKLMAQKLIKES
jgi:hypothetical protein